MKNHVFELMKRFSRIFGISLFYIEFPNLYCTYQTHKKNKFDLDLKQLEEQLSFFDVSKVNLGFFYDTAIFSIPIKTNTDHLDVLLGTVKVNHWILNENNFVMKENIKDIIQLMTLSISGKKEYVKVLTNLNIKPFVIEKHPKDPILEKAKQNIDAGLQHHSYKKEKELMNAIKNGDISLTIKAFEHFKQNSDFYAELSDCEIRHRKNMIIAIITIASRAAIEGGLTKEIAFSLSDYYICEVEKLPNIPNSTKTYIFVEYLLTDFAKKVMRNKKQKASSYIFQCQQIIYSKIYSKISIEELALQLGLSKNYLSTFFKNEMGITLKEYILQQKTSEAQYLILHSNYNFQEICSMLHFSNQSHFINVFKKYTQMTPRQYKNINQLAKE